MANENFGGEQLQPGRGARFLKEWGFLLVMAAVIIVLFRVVLQPAWVPSGSMETTIPEKSLLLSWRLPYLLGDPVLERGDIVTFQSQELGKLLVKRVVGLPGDQITFVGGYVYINDEKLEEPYLPEKEKTAGNQVFLVPEGCYFMMGDNRDGSADSRVWAQPYIPGKAIQAKVMLIISPLPGNSWFGVRTAG